VIAVASFNAGSPNALANPRSCDIYNTDGSGRDIQLGAGGFYFYGFTFNAGDEITGISAAGEIYFEGCRLKQQRLGGAYNIQFSSGTTDASTTCKDVLFSLNASCTTGITVGTGRVEIIGGGIEVAGAAGNTVFSGFGNGGVLLVDGFDMSLADDAWPTGVGSGSESFHLDIRNSLTSMGMAFPEFAHASCSALVTNCKNGTGIEERYRGAQGSVDTETTNVRTGGAQVEGAGYSYEMLPNTTVGEGCPLRCLTITGHADFSTSKTVDIYIANTTRDLKDNEINFDLSYPTYNQGGNTVVNCKGANWLVAPTTHADDTGSTWGGSPTYMQKMSVTAGGATDGREGPYQIQIWLSVDVDVFVDPLPVIT